MALTYKKTSWLTYLVGDWEDKYFETMFLLDSVFFSSTSISKECQERRKENQIELSLGQNDGKYLEQYRQSFCIC